MFFFASKLVWLVVEPVNLCVLGALASFIALRRHPVGARLAGLAFVSCLAVMTFSPLGMLLLRPLEARFPVPAADMPAPYGIIVLGGALDGDLSRKHRQAVMPEGGRVVAGAVLARRYPQARVFYTGGSAAAMGGESIEAEEARKLWIALGVEPERIGLETRSRNTEENAQFSAAILKPQPGQKWLVVTSAFHMPRSMGLFRKAGFDAVAYPTDFHSFLDDRDFQAILFQLGELGAYDLAAHEWLGLTAYYFTGKIDNWFPAP